MMTDKARIQRIAGNIYADNEDIYVGALREYYRREFSNGESDESFILWLTVKMGLHE